MVNMKIDLKGSGVDVNKKSGFEPYEGPTPKPGVYAATIQSCKIRVSTASNQYFNLLYELADQTTADKQQFKGAPIWDKVVPGESDIQKERTAKLLHVVSGKDPAKVNVAVNHEEVTDGGTVNTIGGKNPIGTKVRLTVNRGSYNGEPTVEVRDVFPWPKDEPWPEGAVAEDSDEEIEDEEEAEPEESEEEEEPDEEEEESEEEPEEEEEDEEDDVEAQIAARNEELSALSRVEIKKILKAADPDFKVLKSHEDSDLVNAIIDVEYPPVEGDDEPPF